MDELKFRVSSELKNILGRELITDPNIAILELVKNSYDAHASHVEITFDTDKIVISDNGKGMTLKEIINKWLFVGYSAKRDGTEDASYRKKIKRYFAGAKGIGRLSCDRLARYLQLISQSEESSQAEVLNIDWNNFDNRQKEEFDTIPVSHETIIWGERFPNNSSNGTILVFTGVYDQWDNTHILALKGALEKMINPFGADKFSIEIIAPNYKEADNQTLQKINDFKGSHEQLTSEDRKTLATWENNIVNGEVKNSISEVLNLKTTIINCTLSKDEITTSLIDRGVEMYSIREKNDFKRIQNASINLYYLNRSAKFNFSLKMGIQPIHYGNIFLFRNGFRIWPYGEPNDDSWGINQRAQQGYNRFLSTRDLLGRVDVETDNADDFKEVSSRDGGLIKNQSSQELMSFFNKTFRRLERYVTGVLWGINFSKNDYFVNQKTADKEKKDLQQSDKDSEGIENVYNNIGSKVDFLQLVKNLVNDDSVTVLDYNKKLANIIVNPENSNIIKVGIYSDFRKVAEIENNSDLLEKIDKFELEVQELHKKKVEAEAKAREARYQQEIEKKKRIEAEKNLNAQQQKNKYLTATRNTTQEVQDITHVIAIQSNELVDGINNLRTDLLNAGVKDNRVETRIQEISFYASRIRQLSRLITKADIVSLKTKMTVNVIEYIKEYLSNFRETLTIHVHDNTDGKFIRLFSLLDISIVIDNLISNSKKNGAKTIQVELKNQSSQLLVLFSDDGDGVDLKQYTPESLFEEGVTNKAGGSGIGLHTVRYTLQNELKGSIRFVGNGVEDMKGACFEISFN